MKGKPSRDERAREKREERKGRRDTVQDASEKEGKNGWCTRQAGEGGVGTGLMGSGARGGKLGLLCIRWVLQWRAPGTKYIS